MEDDEEALLPPAITPEAIATEATSPGSGRELTTERDAIELKEEQAPTARAELKEDADLGAEEEEEALHPSAIASEIIASSPSLPDRGTELDSEREAIVLEEELVPIANLVQEEEAAREAEELEEVGVKLALV